jgi:putative ABC transport system ATP-binding protein
MRAAAATLLVGPSGCGKTTLLSVLTGLLDATDGQVSVFGNDIRRLSGASAVLFRRKNLGFVFNSTTYCPS